ncbi:MAG: oligosaccharide repeat unit polymerase family protein [Methanosphaera sp.]|nr:oligosaccharide repeat unit polymerase family protein [Methanosphaera sp.]
MNIKKVDIFNPLILVILVLVYLLFSFIGFEFHLKELVGIHNYTLFVVFLGLMAYIIGFFISRYLLSRYDFEINESKLKSVTTEKVLLAVVILGILFQIINMIYLGGIPLFSGYLKAKAVTRIWLASYLLFLPSINLLLAKYDDKKYYLLFIVGLMLFVLTGYRTTAMAIVLSVFITVYYTKDLPWKYIIISLASIFLLLMVVGYVAVKSIEWQTWTLNPLELLFYRAGYTLQVLDHAVFMQHSTNGQLLYNTLMGFFKSTDPRVIVGSTTLGYAHSTTSTIFGPALLDFGLWAMLIQMFVLGFILKLFYDVQREYKSIFIGLYAMLLAHTIIWIETGPTDLVIFLFFIVSLILLAYSAHVKK